MSTEEVRSRGWIDRLAGLYTPVVADVLDRLGYREQAMRADIRPLFPEARIAGLARTVRTIPAPERCTGRAVQGGDGGGR